MAHVYYPDHLIVGGYVSNKVLPLENHLGWLPLNIFQQVAKALLCSFQFVYYWKEHTILVYNSFYLHSLKTSALNMPTGLSEKSVLRNVLS